MVDMSKASPRPWDVRARDDGSLSMPDPIREALADLSYLTIRDIVALAWLVVFICAVVGWSVALDPVDEPMTIEQGVSK